MHRILEEALEMLCYVIVLTGTLFLFSEVVKDKYHLNYAEQMVHVFFEEAERKQKISPDAMEEIATQLMEIKTGYGISVWVKRRDEVIDREELYRHFAKGEAFCLNRGDIILVCISENNKERSILHAIIWW